MIKKAGQCDNIEFLDRYISPLVGSLLVSMIPDSLLDHLILSLTEALPTLPTLLLTLANATETSMPCNCMFLGLCFIHPILKQKIQDSIGSAPDQESQLAIFDNIKLTQGVLANFINSTVVNRVDPQVLTSEYLMTLNEINDEELFFENMPEEGKSNNVWPHFSKKSALLYN